MSDSVRKILLLFFLSGLIHAPTVQANALRNLARNAFGVVMEPVTLCSFAFSLLRKRRAMITELQQLDTNALSDETLDAVSRFGGINENRVKVIVGQLRRQSEFVNDLKLEAAELARLRDANALSRENLERLVALELVGANIWGAYSLNPKVIRVSLKSGDPETAMAALILLRGRKEDGVVEMLRIAENHTDPDVASFARHQVLARGLEVSYHDKFFEVEKRRLDKLPPGHPARRAFVEELARMADSSLARFLNEKHLQPEGTELPYDFFRSRSSKFIQEIYRIAALEKNVPLQKLLVTGLYRRFDPIAMEVLAESIRSPSSVVREATLRVLETHFSEPALKILKSRIAELEAVSSGDSRELGFLQLTVSRIKVPPSIEEFKSLVNGEYSMEVLDVLTRIGHWPNEYLELALKSPHARIRQRASAELSQRVDPDSLYLAQLALVDPVQEIQLDGVEMLLRSATGKADRMLFDLADHGSAEIRRRIFEGFQTGRGHVLREAGGDQLVRAASIRLWDETARKAKGSSLKNSERLSAIRAADNVYEVAEPALHQTAQDLVKQHKRFLEGVPAGYQAVDMVGEPTTGLKLAVYEPLPHFKNRPVILAVAGTETFTDWLTNSNLGRSQRESPVMETIRAQALRYLRKGEEVVITGHSLGGAVAQAVYYDILSDSRASTEWKLRDKLRAYTWNAYGGLELIQKREKANLEILGAMNVENYYVPGDPVSRIGTHIGPVLRLQRSTYKNGVDIHSMTAVLESATGKGLERAEEGEPWKWNLVTMGAGLGVGRLGEAWQAWRGRVYSLQFLDKMLEARSYWDSQEGYRSTSGEQWLSRETEIVIDNLPEKQRREGLERLSAYLENRERTFKALRMPPSGSTLSEVR